MNCIEVREELIEAGAAPGEASNAAQLHLAGCSACSTEWEAMHQTMALLDEWKAPEPSPYFATRLRARVREEARQPESLLARLRGIFAPGFFASRRAGLVSAMAVLLFAGLLMFRSAGTPGEEHPLHNNEIVATMPGTPVGDMQALDKNYEMYANFDLLDDIGNTDTGVSN
ncbi:MAG: hypothetical protein JO041_15045 [Acidobacteria bacterium]|nr:hypothetical protein [Acidobacteriota bacterium]